MNITKEILEEKLRIFKDRYIKLNEEINAHIALSKKVEGAIETIELLLEEINTANKE